MDYPGAEWCPSANLDAGRNGAAINAIVLHWSAGSEDATINWLRNPASGASAHYVIGRAGNFTQLVREVDCAWHCGDLATNRHSLGVEVVADAQNAPTEAQYAALVAFVAAKAWQYGIPISADTIIRHSDVVATQCPGSLDVERVIAELSDEELPQESSDWNGADWWQELSERDRWLKYVDVDGSNKELVNVQIPHLRQEVAQLQAQLRACESLGRQVVSQASLTGG